MEWLSKFESEPEPEDMNPTSRLPLSGVKFYVYQDLNEGVETAPGHSLKIEELMKLRQREMDNLILTFEKKIALSSTLDEINNLLKVDDEFRLVKGFHFFQIKCQRMSKSKTGSKAKYLIQLIDVTKKVLLEGTSLEKQQMTILNSTVSHEMRNPLNSIQAQMHMLESKLKDL